MALAQASLKIVQGSVVLHMVKDGGQLVLRAIRDYDQAHKFKIAMFSPEDQSFVLPDLHRFVNKIPVRGAHGLTAIIKRTNGMVQVSLTNLGGTVLKEDSFPSDVTVLVLQETIQERIRGRVFFYSDAGSRVGTEEPLRDHDRLTCQCIPDISVGSGAGIDQQVLLDKTTRFVTSKVSGKRYLMTTTGFYVNDPDSGPALSNEPGLEVDFPFNFAQMYNDLKIKPLQGLWQGSRCSRELSCKCSEKHCEGPLRFGVPIEIISTFLVPTDDQRRTQMPLQAGTKGSVASVSYSGSRPDELIAVFEGTRVRIAVADVARVVRITGALSLSQLRARSRIARPRSQWRYAPPPCGDRRSPCCLVPSNSHSKSRQP